MNEISYEEYMRNILGYKPREMDYQDTYDMDYMFDTMDNQEMDLQECYPEIYKIVYPMVQKACIQNTRAIDRDLVDNITEEIYFAIEDNEISEENREQEDRQKRIRNNTLNDLIRILILRELLGGPGFPGRPPIRPPMPPRPPRPPHRPPVRPPRPPHNQPGRPPRP
ncbi:MAG: hypothetical protein HFJ55_04115 [Clostridia bacterium]|jgi:hypothetical protein|nr:hypothetical protein [Clostridia bacterium]